MRVAIIYGIHAHSGDDTHAQLALTAHQMWAIVSSKMMSDTFIYLSACDIPSPFSLSLPLSVAAFLGQGVENTTYQIRVPFQSTH